MNTTGPENDVVGKPVEDHPDANVRTVGDGHTTPTHE